MRTVYKFLPVLLLISTCAYAEPPAQSDDIWYAYLNGACLEKSPMEVMVYAQMRGYRSETKDVEEKGKVVSTILTLTGTYPWQRESVIFYRSMKRCEGARRSDEKKHLETIERYR